MREDLDADQLVRSLYSQRYQAARFNFKSVLCISDTVVICFWTLFLKAYVPRDHYPEYINVLERVSARA